MFFARRKGNRRKMTSDRNILTNPACRGGILTNPGYYRNNSEQSHPLTKVFWPIPLASVVILSIPTHNWRNSDASLPSPKVFRPIPPTTRKDSEQSLPPQMNSVPSHPTCCQRNSNQSHQMLKFWQILPATEGNLNIATLCWRNSDKSCQLSKELWLIPPAPEGVLTDPASYRIHSEQSYLLPMEFWAVQPVAEGILSNPAHYRSNVV